ncbi:hypothetical protein BD324DRAFT_652809 [Kockovaella imperatae]|uniref:CDP-alcohol phosphatidyltransferase-domain-containing protein n=1 Tax=Kockovaella imperatae TaxID=4999 RepID=A0A1Y1UAM9_9TREE|nr:hypothetical protein BD324DRAFT_652809 [Kockovaella imperatae]ORX35093.1 hypothetical protein BD324DRAFT_652809 [Kockovaella imperatae]
MLDRALRPVKEVILQPCLGFIPASLSPMSITYLGFAIGLSSPLFACLGSDRLALIAWLLNRLLDGLDGTVARLRSRQTSWGGFMDIVCDFTIYTLLPIGIAYSPSAPLPNETMLPLALLLGSFHINNVILFYLASAVPPTTTVKEMTSLQMIPALIEGSESFCFFTIMILCPSWFKEIAYGMSVLVGINILQRSLLARDVMGKMVDREKKKET